DAERAVEGITARRVGNGWLRRPRQRDGTAGRRLDHVAARRQVDLIDTQDAGDVVGDGARTGAAQVQHDGGFADLRWAVALPVLGGAPQRIAGGPRPDMERGCDAILQNLEPRPSPAAGAAKPPL